MTIPHLVSINSELPLRVTRFKLDPKKLDEFNDGKFARSDYKYLYRMVIDKGEGKTYIELATPSFRQLLYSIRVLWNAWEGKPYDRHDHPVVMQAFSLMPIPMESRDKEVDKRFQKSYSKHKSKSTAKSR